MQRHRTSRRCKPAVLFYLRVAGTLQSVSFDACRFRADVAVLLVLAQSSRLLPVRGVVLLLRFVNLSSLSLSLPVHLSSFFPSGVRLCLDSLQRCALDA
jgi:hypothetical protein